MFAVRGFLAGGECADSGWLSQSGPERFTVVATVLGQGTYNCAVDRQNLKAGAWQRLAYCIFQSLIGEQGDLGGGGGRFGLFLSLGCSELHRTRRARGVTDEPSHGQPIRSCVRARKT